MITWSIVTDFLLMYWNKIILFWRLYNSNTAYLACGCNFAENSSLGSSMTRAPKTANAISFKGEKTNLTCVSCACSKCKIRLDRIFASGINSDWQNSFGHPCQMKDLLRLVQKSREVYAHRECSQGRNSSLSPWSGNSMRVCFYQALERASVAAWVVWRWSPAPTCVRGLPRSGLSSISTLSV